MLGVPLRAFGKTDVKVSALGLGGHHLGAAKDEQTAVSLIHKALDGGIISTIAVGSTTEESPKIGWVKG